MMKCIIFLSLSLFVANGRGKTSVVSLSSSPGSVGARQSVHRRDSAREHSEVERSGEQGGGEGKRVGGRGGVSERKKKGPWDV